MTDAPVRPSPVRYGEPLQVPATVTEADRRPKRLKVVTTRSRDANGKPIVIMRPAPGYTIERVIMTDLDQSTKRCKPAVIVEKRRGRPHNSQRRENGASED